MVALGLQIAYDAEGSPYKLLEKNYRQALEHVIRGTDTIDDTDALRRAFYVNHAETFASERQKIDELKKELYGERYTPLTGATPRR